ncbi:MAG: hypothetical protein IPG50_28005 [Myxococcales bacterium]|nr:hypothetical protein [Myxococcales bacterium]
MATKKTASSAKNAAAKKTPGPNAASRARVAPTGASAPQEAGGGAFEPGVQRFFKHTDGRTYTLEVDGCRVYESWTLAAAKGKGQRNVATRNDEESAQGFASDKVTALLRKGFVEGKPLEGRRYDTDADVIEVFHNDLDYDGERRSDFQPVAGRAHVHAHSNVSVAEWLVTSDDRRLGILLRCAVWQSKVSPDARAKMADAILDFVTTDRAAIFADRATPLRKRPLRKPIGPFSHLVVLSPQVANVTVSRDVNVENVAIARSVYEVFPAYACEVVGDETLTVAEARTTGRGCIPSAHWDRAPHPVVDLAYLNKPDDSPTFLVFDPDEVEKRFAPTAFKKIKEAAVLARNHAGQVKKLSRTDSPPSLADLRAFFGFA